MSTGLSVKRPPPTLLDVANGTATWIEVDFACDREQRILTRALAAADAIVSLETELDDEVFTITVLLDGPLSGVSWAGECILGGIAGSFELTQS